MPQRKQASPNVGIGQPCAWRGDPASSAGWHC